MKKNITKLIVLLFIVSTALSSFTFADSTPVLRLTLEEAQKMALDNNVQYDLQDSYISDALDNYYNTQDTNDKLSQRPSTNFMDYFNRTITPEISVDSAANSVKAARFKKEDLKRASDYNVKAAFLNIKKAQYELDSKKNDSEIKSKELESAKVKYDLGQITKDELTTYEKAYSDSVQAQLAALEDLHSKYQTLNKYIGRPITNYDIEIVYNPSKVDISSIDLDSIREANIKNNQTYYDLEQKVTLAKRKYDLTKERYDHFEELGVQNSKQDMLDAYSDAERDYTNAQKAFEDATKSLDIGLNSTYTALKNTSDAVDRLERDIKDATDSLAKLKLQYDLGMVSRNTYEEKEISLKTMQNSLSSLISDMELQYSNLMLYSNTEVATAK